MSEAENNGSTIELEGIPLGQEITTFQELLNLGIDKVIACPHSKHLFLVDSMDLRSECPSITLSYTSENPISDYSGGGVWNVTLGTLERERESQPHLKYYVLPDKSVQELRSRGLKFSEEERKKKEIEAGRVREHIRILKYREVT